MRLAGIQGFTALEALQLMRLITIEPQPLAMGAAVNGDTVSVFSSMPCRHLGH
jgi:hypothetical protein